MASAEEEFLTAMADEEPYEDGLFVEKRREADKKRQRAAADYLGDGATASEALRFPRYYNELMAWSVQQKLSRDGWKTVKVRKNNFNEANIIEVQTGIGTSLSAPVDAHLMVQKEQLRLVVTISHALHTCGVAVTGRTADRDAVKAFISGIKHIAKTDNIYRGKKFEFSGVPNFINLESRDWDNVVIEDSVKAEIRANTVGYLKDRERLARYGIPPRRGILLAGPPGTGKTAVCKAVTSEAEGITGIITGAYDLVSDNYFRVLYEIAGDLAPSIVVIEDLDLVAQEREDHGIHTSPLLIALLNILDGLEKTSAVVTVATTNHLEALDKAIRERPSRFDRVIRMELPEFGERKALAALLSRRIPVETGVADLIASETGGCSPAQIQEVFYTMAIGHHCNEQCRQQGMCRFSMEEARTALGFMKKKTRHMGFQSVGFPGREAADVAQPGFGKNRA